MVSSPGYNLIKSVTDPGIVTKPTMDLNLITYPSLSDRSLFVFWYLVGHYQRIALSQEDSLTGMCHALGERPGACSGLRSGAWPWKRNNGRLGAFN